MRKDQDLNGADFLLLLSELLQADNAASETTVLSNMVLNYSFIYLSYYNTNFRIKWVVSIVIFFV